MADLSKKMHVRAGHRSATTIIIKRCQDLLAAHPVDKTKLLPLKISVREKLDTLKRMDDELVDSNKVNGEIEQADEIKENIYTVLVQLDDVLSPSAASSPIAATTSANTHHHVPPARDKVRLPKITLQPIDRDLTTWTTFWDSFKAAINKNNSLTDIDKINYLRGLLQRTALEAISGLTLTSANYREALAILQKRFGNKPLIVAKYMDALMHVEAVTSHHNVKGLCHLYDSVESNVRSLTTLGVDSKSYRTLLASVLISKVPQELQLIVTRRITGI